MIVELRCAICGRFVQFVDEDEYFPLQEYKPQVEHFVGYTTLCNDSTCRVRLEALREESEKELKNETV